MTKITNYMVVGCGHYCRSFKTAYITILLSGDCAGFPRVHMLSVHTVQGLFYCCTRSQPCPCTSSGGWGEERDVVSFTLSVI